MANQSTTHLQDGASKAVDGNHNTHFFGGSCSHTGVGDANPWWYVDLGQQYRIESVALTNRGDHSCKLC